MIVPVESQLQCPFLALSYNVLILAPIDVLAELPVALGRLISPWRSLEAVTNRMPNFLIAKQVLEYLIREAEEALFSVPVASS